MKTPKWLRRIIDPKFRRRSAGAKRAALTRRGKRGAGTESDNPVTTSKE